jgi:hypothetical protein
LLVLTLFTSFVIRAAADTGLYTSDERHCCH